MRYNRTELAAALDALGCVVTTKLYAPIFGCVLIQESHIGATLTGVSHGSQLSVSVSGEPGGVGQLGQFCVPLAWLKRAVREARKEKFVTLESEKSTATFRFGNSVSKVATLPAEDFPSAGTPAVSDGELTVYGCDELVTVLRALHCYSRDETRESLCRVLFDAEARRGVATDGHRMSVIDLPESWQLGTDHEIPGSAIPALICLADGIPGHIVHQPTRNGCTFVGDRWTFICSMSHGGFPPWRQVIPPEAGETFRVDGQRLLDALRRLPKPAKKGKVVGITLTVRESEIQIEFNDLANDVSASEKVSLDGWYPELLIEPFCLDPRYLRDSLEALPAGNVTFTVPPVIQGQPPMTPVMLQAGQQIELIMQMRI